MKKTILMIAVIGVVLIGCQTTQQVMNSWIGHTKHELILSWGPPTSVMDDGNGGEILIYDKRINMGSTTNGSASVNSNGNIDYSERTRDGSFTSRRMMYVDKEGKIYYWKQRAY